ncbi:DUF5666 domain-containing protein [Thermoflexus sp.]|uniref:DUF5666 domain-containing protein n=1 Tax=Thermoflexus sp. TaxID=1969742 RepID=UPI0025D396EF|nr:DUF5666 domain-containing protein [Thermoflexus sp.]MCS6963728.1 DUF5666 domain-containing protein [Thermoflexus sp.]MCX7691680.1 DUF5666 domain-containing protein [Thermoflexus sp.]MDW8185483.1 DUF5666 domain-containing protein [Anaerolineae bacterium]
MLQGWKKFIGAVLGSLLLLSWGTGMAWPQAVRQARAPARVIVRGTIAKVDPAAKRLEVKTAKGETVEVVGTDKTILLVIGIRKPTWSDLHPGERVLVVGTRADGKVEALRIGVRPPVQTFHGTITEIQENRLVLETAKGKANLLTDDRTRFHVPGVKNPTLKDFKAGDRANALGVGRFDDTWYVTLMSLVRRGR